jgi:hypothetical protein
LRYAKIQPFRIVNRERVAFGDRKANYVNIVGELLLRICKRIDADGVRPLILNVYQAGVKNSEYEEGDLPFWEHSDFVPTLQTVFQRAGIANGWAEESAKWRLGRFTFCSGTKDKRLWLCELISDASHDDFKTISTEAAESLQEALGPFDFTLSFNTTLDQVRQLADRESYGVAAIELAERMLSPRSSDEAKAAYTREFDRIAPALLALPPLARGPQLRTILGWLHQTADNRERLSDARAACKWIESRLVDKHAEQMAAKDETLASWVRLGITTAALTACNHGGDLAEGRVQSARLDQLVPELAGRWEHASDLMQALVIQGVHLNDCFEHEKVIDKLSLVTGYYRSLGGFFHEAYPEVFPEEVRSKLCGEALGTMLQSQVFLLLAGKSTVDAVRATSDQAIGQFSDEDDRSRQYQYRSEVEAISGEWQSAREFLAQGIGSTAVDHAGLGSVIASLDEAKRGFPLLHWTRIGGMAAIAGATGELEDFVAAWKSSGLERSEWSVGEIPFYPAHGILRRLASVYAAIGDVAKLTETLRLLRSVVQSDPKTLFRLIEAAAILQAAGLAGQNDVEVMERILRGSKQDPAPADLLAKLVNDATPAQPKIAGMATSWKELVTGKADPRQLVSAADVVAY